MQRNVGEKLLYEFTVSRIELSKKKNVWCLITIMMASIQ